MKFGDRRTISSKDLPTASKIIPQVFYRSVTPFQQGVHSFPFIQGKVTSRNRKDTWKEPKICWMEDASWELVNRSWMELRKYRKKPGTELVCYNGTGRELQIDIGRLKERRRTLFNGLGWNCDRIGNDAQQAKKLSTSCHEIVNSQICKKFSIVIHFSNTSSPIKLPFWIK